MTKSLQFFMPRTSNMQRIFLISTEKTRSREKTLQNGPIFRIISAICMMKRLPLAMSFAAMQQMNLQRTFLKNTLTKIQQFLISAAAAVFFLSLPCFSAQKVPSALILTRLQLKQPRQMHLKTALTKANSRQFRAICQTR